jgi:hypothetical protein
MGGVLPYSFCDDMDPPCAGECVSSGTIEDHYAAGFIVITQDASPPKTIKNWECVPQNLPSGWATYQDGYSAVHCLTSGPDNRATIAVERFPDTKDQW